MDPAVPRLKFRGVLFPVSGLHFPNILQEFWELQPTNPSQHTCSFCRPQRIAFELLSCTIGSSGFPYFLLLPVDWLKSKTTTLLPGKPSFLRTCRL